MLRGEGPTTLTLCLVMKQKERVIEKSAVIELHQEMLAMVPEPGSSQCSTVCQIKEIQDSSNYGPFGGKEFFLFSFCKCLPNNTHSWKTG